MAVINIKTNISFFLVLLSIIILAFIEGAALSNAIGGEKTILGSEIQLIAFILISIFMVIISTLKPDRLIMVSYSSMTLGLIVIITGLFDPNHQAPLSIKTTEAVVGVILIIAGAIMVKGLRLNMQEQATVREGLRNYRRL
ncbi:MAG: hypothetical protein QT11_C0001G0296 [archaeon GW2011_AR20]|nr:MAG: hypothetical protein QT11_C0001G0296 [archaeon GW2011_AR20]AQS28464.1 hypothetical protein [uncultured archaeon]MBS3160303.1 hypothetical protein [Candidatus Woesearchaeota archaeon]